MGRPRRIRSHAATRVGICAVSRMEVDHLGRKPTAGRQRLVVGVQLLLRRERAVPQEVGDLLERRVRHQVIDVVTPVEQSPLVTVDEADVRGRDDDVFQAGLGWCVHGPSFYHRGYPSSSWLEYGEAQPQGEPNISIDRTRSPTAHDCPPWTPFASTISIRSARTRSSRRSAVAVSCPAACRRKRCSTSTRITTGDWGPSRRWPGAPASVPAAACSTSAPASVGPRGPWRGACPRGSPAWS